MPFRQTLGAICFFFLLFIACQPASGQQKYVVEHIDISEALPSLGLGTHAIAQDKRGVMWLACHDGGLIRYDGSSFRIFSHTASSKPRLSGPVVRDVITDRAGNLWVSNDSGIDVLDPTSLRIIKTIPVASPNPMFRALIQSICLGPDGDIWAACQFRGILRIPQGDADRIQSFDTILLPTYINYSPDGGLWCISDPEKIYHWQNDHFQQYNYKVSKKPKATAFLRPIEDDEGRFVGFNNVLKDETYEPYRIDPNSGRVLPGEPETGITPFLSPFISNEMLRHTSPLSKAPLLHHPLKTLKDAQGITWVAPGAGGIFKLKPVEMKFVTCPELKGASLRSMLETKEGKVYIGSYNGLFEYTIATNKAVLLSKPGEALFYHLAQYQNDTLALFTEGVDYGNFVIGYPGKFIFRSSQPSDIGGCIFNSVPIGQNQVLLGNQHIFKLNTSNWHAEPFCELPTSPTTRTLTYQRTRDGKLWVGTTDGVFLIDNENNCAAPPIRREGRLGSGSQVNDIYEDQSGKLWFATRNNGLVCYNPTTDKFRYFDRTTGFASNEAYAIIGSQHDELIWVSTYAGLQCLSQSSGKISLFTEIDGTSGTEFNTNSYLQLSNGEILMGGVGGLTRFNPLDYHPQHQNNPEPFITSVQVVDFFSNDTININYPPNDTSYLFSPTENTIQFQYGCNSYFHSDAYTYYIMLEGIDKDWIPMGAVSKIKYYHLIPGKYTFRVRLIENRDERKVNDFSMGFEIEQVFYKKSWFIVLLALLFIGLVLLFFWSRRQRTLRDEKIRRAIAKDLHSMLGGKLSQISNMLHVVKRLKTNGQPIDEELKYLTEFTRLAHGNLSDVIWVLAQKDDLDGGLMNRMEDYIDKWLRSAKIKASFEQNISEGEAKIPLAFQYQLLLIFSEALSNIIKHTDSYEVKIRLWQNDDESKDLIVINYFKQRKNNPPTSGQGLAIIRELIAKIGGTVDAQPSENEFCLSIHFAPNSNNDHFFKWF